jgi:hypothetical protein
MIVSRQSRKLLPVLLLAVGLSGCDRVSEPAPDASRATEALPKSLIKAGAGCSIHRESDYEVLRWAMSFKLIRTDWIDKIMFVEVEALACMTREPDAVARLRKLLHDGSLVGQLYALVGLRALDKERFDEIVRPYFSNETVVRTIKGDVSTLSSVADLADWIETGYCTRDLLPELIPLIPETETGARIE